MDGNDKLKGLVLSYKMFLEETSEEGILFLSKNLAEYGLINDAIALLIRYLTEGGPQDKIINIIEPFPDEIKELFKKSSPPTAEDEDFDAQSYLEMADLLWDIGSPDDAKQNYVRAIQGLAAKGEVDRANEILATVKERYPDDPEIQNLQISGAPSSQEILQSLQSIHYDIPPEKEGELRLKLGMELLQEGIVEQGLSELAKASNLGGSFGDEAGRKIVEFYFNKGDLEETLSSIDEYLAGDTRLEYLYRVAEAIENSGNTERAMDIYRTIYSANPEFKDVKIKLAPPEEKKEEPVPHLEIPEPTPPPTPAPSPKVEETRPEREKEEKAEVKKVKKVKAVKLEEENIIFL